MGLNRFSLASGLKPGERNGMSSSAITRHENELAAYAEWEWNCAQLAAFVRQRGHCNLGEHPLGEWLRRQQNAVVAGRLSEERQLRLAVLGISFEPQDGAWDAMFRRLRQCLKRQRVPLKKSREQWLPEAPDEDLAAWLGEQRQIHSQGLLRADRLRRLQPLKVIGNSRKYQEKENKPLKSDVSWEARYSELCDFSGQFGHCDVPKAYAPNPPLSNWVSMQREKQKRGKLDRSRYERLDALGFAWFAKNRRSDRCWDQRFAELRAFKQKHGHIRGVKEMGKQLFSWRNTQRGLRREGKLSAERIARLDAIGFEWADPRLQGLDPQIGWEKRWEFFFDQLKEFKKQRGHTLVPSDWRENKQLATWVAEQRKARRRGILPAKRQKRLEQIGFEWKPPGRKRVGPPPPKPEPRYTTLWNRLFAELQTFHKKHGHTRVSPRDGAPRHLIAWRFTQQDKYRKGKLSAERVAKLNAMGFEWESPGRDGRTRREMWQGGWDAMLEKLARFRRANGHCRISSQDPANSVLGRWAAKQRAAKRRGTLNTQRVARLNALGFEWNPPVGLTLQKTLPPVQKRRKT